MAKAEGVPRVQILSPRMHKVSSEDIEKALLRAIPGKVWKAFLKVSVGVSWGFRRVSKGFPKLLEKRACEQTPLLMYRSHLGVGFLRMRMPLL